MFGSVRKMVSVFETRKQPGRSSTRTPPNIPPPPSVRTSTPGPPPIPFKTPCDPTGEGGQGSQKVVLRRRGAGRPHARLRESWPVGNLRLFITVETEEPITRGTRCSPECNRSRTGPWRSSSSTQLNTCSTTGPSSTMGPRSSSTSMLNTCSTFTEHLTSCTSTTRPVSSSTLNSTSIRGPRIPSSAPGATDPTITLTVDLQSSSISVKTTSASVSEPTCSSTSPTGPLSTCRTLFISGGCSHSSSSTHPIPYMDTQVTSVSSAHPTPNTCAARGPPRPSPLHPDPGSGPVCAAATVASSGRGEKGKGRSSGQRSQLRPSDSTLLSLLPFLHSGSSTSMVAIDNKIEQAMDLVKAHLMQAVREEVEVLREQIKELSEKNAQLERENYILKALRDQH